MKLVDPSLELVVVGSSNSAMPTFGAWEDTVLDLTWEIADHISLHTYYDPEGFETVDDFLGCSRDLDRTRPRSPRTPTRSPTPLSSGRC